ncbi:DNA polymerase III subunit beta [Halothiobacillus sp. DCM-1]|uniref:DNA polymerase III subunit beta n=1 Tax=Halothiobacillus sp. DCM-1 TaxID=3112558 RepID=UPI0032503A6F
MSMNFRVNRDALLQAIAQVIGGVEKRQTMQILGNVYLSLEQGVLTLITTDLEIQLRTELAVEMGAAGATTVNAKKLADIVKMAPDGASLALHERESWLEIDAGRGKFRLATLPADGFPRMNAEGAAGSAFEIPQNALYRLIEKTQFSMAQQDVRYFLNGLLFDQQSDALVTVATDGHRLACARLHGVSAAQPRQVIVPRKMVMEMQKTLLRDSAEPVQLTLRDQQIELVCGDHQLISKLIDGRYPDYQRVIPKNNPMRALLNKADLRGVLQRASILSNERLSGAEFKLSPQELIIDARNAESESSSESMPMAFVGDPMNITFNISYLLQILAVIDTDQVQFELDGAESSALIRPEDDPDALVSSLFVLMPMKM